MLNIEEPAGCLLGLKASAPPYFFPPFFFTLVGICSFSRIFEISSSFFFFQAEDCIRCPLVTGVQTCDLPISLFGLLQVTAAQKASLSPLLLAAGNSSGGVLGKMLSPQNLAIGAAAVGLAGEEGELFRRVLGWSLLFLLVM